MYGNSFYAYSDSPGFAINSYSMANIVSSVSRFNYGLRSIYDAAVHGASRVGFRIGDTERAYVTTSGVANNSLAEQKAEIQDAGSALSIIKDATLYQYRYTVPPVEALPEKEGDVVNAQAIEAEPQLSPERMGFVIGEGYEPPPDCVLAEDGRGVNLYAMSAVCWKAVQELLTRVDALEAAVQSTQ